MTNTSDNGMKVLVFFVTAFSLVLLLNTYMQQAHASEITYGLSSATDPNVVFFRDVTSFLNDTATMSLDAESYAIGQTATLTINDFNANLDPATQEEITTIISSITDPVGITITLTEDDINSGVFVGTFVLTSSPSSGSELQVSPGDELSVSYEPQETFSGRLKASVNGVITDGTVEVSDYDFSADELVTLCFEPITRVVNFTLIGAAIDPDPAIGTIDVTMSYSNAITGVDPLVFDPSVIQMYHFNLATGWETVSFLFDVGIDTDAQTVTNTVPITSDGLFVLAFDNGCAGGGAGGLVRPGLVLNVLAGIAGFGGSGGPDHSPPSLVISRPTSILSQFGFVAPDPFKPISPTTDSSTPLKINNKGYFLTGYANTIEPEQVSTGENVGLTLSFLEATSVQHVALHFVDENSDEPSDTDPMIMFDNGNVIKSDPDGILGDQIIFTTSKDGFHSIFNFGFSFDQPTKRHLMIVVWDEKRNAANTKIFDAFNVSGKPVPQEENHLVLQDLGQYVITQDGVIDVQAQSNTIQQEQVVGFEYADSIGRLDRHDMTLLHSSIDNEQAKASAIIENFDLETDTFVAKDVVKPYDTSKRAPQLTWSNIGHKIRDIANTSENKDLVHKLMWEEHLKAGKILKAYLEQRNHRE